MLNPVRIISIAFIFFLVGCSSDQSLENDKDVLSIFSAEEAKDLQKIHDFFADQVCELTHTSDANPADCFESFMLDMQPSGLEGAYSYTISSKAINKLFERFESKIFDHIWSTSIISDEFGNTHETIDLAIYEKKYSDFLEVIGKRDQTIADYHESLLRSGALSSTVIADMLVAPEKYDINDSAVRLIIAVHYITIYHKPII